MERPKRGLSAFDDIERLDQLGEVGKRPRQPVDLVDDDHVDLARWGKRGSGPVVPIALSQIGAAHVVARQDATVPAPNRNESA